MCGKSSEKHRRVLYVQQSGLCTTFFGLRCSFCSCRIVSIKTWFICALLWKKNCLLHRINTAGQWKYLTVWEAAAAPIRSLDMAPAQLFRSKPTLFTSFRMTLPIFFPVIFNSSISSKLSAPTVDICKPRFVERQSSSFWIVLDKYIAFLDDDLRWFSRAVSPDSHSKTN